jgi:hypothetical protein
LEDDDSELIVTGNDKHEEFFTEPNEPLQKLYTEQDSIHLKTEVPEPIRKEILNMQARKPLFSNQSSSQSKEAYPLEKPLANKYNF